MRAASSARLRYVGPALAAGGAVVLGLPALSWPVNGLDEMILLVYPQRMLGGDLPYRDFFAAYGPGHWWLLEGYFSLTTTTVLAERILGLIVHAGLALALYWLVAPHGRALATTTSLLAGIMLFTLGDAPYAWLIVAILCIAQVAALASPTARRTAFAGLVAGLAISVRPDATLLAVLPALPLLWHRHLWRRWGAASVAGLTPLWIGLLLTPGPLLFDIFGARAGRGAGQSRLPFWPDSNAARQLLLILLATWLLLLVLAVRTRSRESLALVLLAVCALPQAFQRADVFHFNYAALLALPLLPHALTTLVADKARAQKSSALVSSLAGVLLVLLGTAGTAVRPLLDELRGDGPRSVVVQHQGRDLPQTVASARILRSLLSTIDRDSAPGQVLFVFDENLVRPAVNDVGLYFLLPHLRVRARNMEVTPGVTSERGGGLATDVLRADVVVLIDAPEWFRRALFPYERNGSRDAQDALASHFCRAATIAYYDVYLRCAHTS